MEFTLEFFEILYIDLVHAAPLLIFLLSLVVVIGFLIGRVEGWSLFDSLYHAFINATTVGYGDFRPTDKRSKLLAVMLAVVGLVFTGMVVAIALHAANHAYAVVYDTTGFRGR